MSIIVQFFPNGEFTHGYDSSKRRKSRLEKLSDKLHQSNSPAEQQDICADMREERMSAYCFDGVEFESRYALYTCLRRDGKQYYYSVEPWEDNLDPYVVESEHNPLAYSRLVGATPPLGLSDGAKFTGTSKPASYCKGLTKRMARTIRNAGYLLEQMYGKDNLSFLTLTLPDLPPDGLQACAENWGRMVDQFLKWLRDRIESKGGRLDYTYCTEVQEKRLERRGEYALHLHLLFGGRTSVKTNWYVQPSQVRKAWIRCIKSVYPGVFQGSALENLQRVKYSAAGYIAKYVSKGTQNNAPQRHDNDVPWFTGHWGGCSRDIRQSIERNSFRVAEGVHTGEIARMLIRAFPRLRDCGVVRYYRQGFIQTDRGQNVQQGRGIHVGVGCLTTPTYKLGLAHLYDFIVDAIKCGVYEELLTST